MSKAFASVVVQMAFDTKVMSASNNAAAAHGGAGSPDPAMPGYRPCWPSAWARRRASSPMSPALISPCTAG